MTQELHLEIAADLRRRFPDIVCGGFIVEGLSRLRAIEFPTYDEIRTALAEEGIAIETIAQEPRIAGWRSAIQASGAKSAKVRGSAEQLGRRVLRGGDIKASALVDLYCRCSARFLAPLGGYDLDRLSSNTIHLRHAQDGDVFEPLGGDAADMQLTPAIPVYAIGGTVICWLFNVRDSVWTSLSPTTERALFLTEAVSPVQAEASRHALNALATALQDAGASVGEIAWTDNTGHMTLGGPIGSNN